MKKLLSAAALATAMLATPALAEMHGSVGYSVFNSNDDDIDVSLGAVTGRVGTQFSPNFGAELEASIGVAEDTIDVLGTDVEVSLSHAVSVYLVGAFPMNESFDLFGRVGVGTAEIEADALGTTVDSSGSGFEIGGGGRYFFGGGNHGIRADYTYSDTISSHVFSIGYAFRFGGE